MALPNILCIETSAGICSVAVSRGDSLLYQAIEYQKNNAADKINSLIDEALAHSGIPMRELQAVAVSGGPGSYTGLRIGVSTAKGIAYALKIPLINVETFMAMKVQLEYHTTKKFDAYIPMIDARRMDMFLAIIDNENRYVLKPQCLTIDKKFFNKCENFKKTAIFGQKIEKINIFLENNDFEVFDNIALEAKSMVKIAHDKLKQKQIEDLFFYEPKYYKSFHSSRK